MAGNANAQHQLYQQYASVMLGVCYRYTKSMEDAQDVLQEGFINVFKNLAQFKMEGELGAWIRRIMVNAALNYLKRKKRYQYDMLLPEEHLHPVSDDDPIIQLNAKDVAMLIRQLPAGYQTIFNLHAVEGYPHVEIAQMMGITESTSRTQYMRARKLLIDWLTKPGVKKLNHAG
ncbi:RNA polymerase sigma factor [Filimonas lacunae]|uniref:RNA polymerase sigma factor n=1 Tax=Filimonas lacunae TaxID=477680 RepID=UPI001E56D8B0|nr:sigma-70 family RNA polymerase sigma factor [Filimonas lacunae]